MERKVSEQDRQKPHFSFLLKICRMSRKCSMFPVGAATVSNVNFSLVISATKGTNDAKHTNS